MKKGNKVKFIGVTSSGCGAFIGDCGTIKDVDEKHKAVMVGCIYDKCDEFGDMYGDRMFPFDSVEVKKK